jgi:hypothetical protein
LSHEEEKTKNLFITEIKEKKPIKVKISFGNPSDVDACAKGEEMRCN